MHLQAAADAVATVVGVALPRAERWRAGAVEICKGAAVMGEGGEGEGDGGAELQGLEAL